ncbi:MAG: flap endonuclease-1 [Thermoplasmatota archaeon]
MGIDLGGLVTKHPSSLQAWNGKKVAFDAWNVLYQFLSSIRQPDGTPLKAANGDITSHLAGTLYRTAALVEAGVKPIFVFDGQPHALKQETIAARSARRDAAQGEYADALAEGDEEKALTKAKQTSRLTWDMAEEAKELLQLLGVPVVEAPSEGEAQAAWMASSGAVDASCSQDFDSLLFGAPRLVRNLTVTGRRKLPGKQVWVDVAPEEIRLEEMLSTHDISREQLVDVALLVGTDFHPGIHGIGAKKALGAIQKNGDLETLLDRLNGDPGTATSALERAILEQQEALADREAIRSIFLQPEHVNVDPVFGKADADGVHGFMVDRFGFSAERVDGALKRFEAARSRANQQSLFDF